jgi:hypothetical protein
MPQVLAMTMAHNEGDMLRRWVTYYGGQVGRRNLLVLDHGSTDGSTDELDNVPIVHIPRKVPDRMTPGWFDLQRTRAINRIALGLLAFYDAIIYSDTDEFLIADPAVFGSLLEVVEHHSEEGFIAGVGLNVLHDAEHESALDPARPVLEQRHVAAVASGYCKPLIRRSQEEWLRGFHGATVPYRVIPGLYLLHLKFADVDEQRRRHRDQREFALTTGAGHQSWWVQPQQQVDKRISSLLRSPIEPLEDAGLDHAALVQRVKRGWRAPVKSGPKPVVKLPAAWSSVV